MTRSRLGAAAIVLLASLASCIATETGNPRGNPIVDPSRIDGRSEGVPTPSSTTVTIEGAPGAIEPPDGEVLAWGLDDNVPPARGPVAEDGSFLVMVTVGFDPRIRLRARRPLGARSTPLDRTVAGPMLQVVTPSLPCARIEPGPAVDARPTATIVLRNECEQSLTRVRARLREANLGFELVDDGALVLAPGEAATIEVRRASAVEDAEDIVILDVVEPTDKRRRFDKGTMFRSNNRGRSHKGTTLRSNNRGRSRKGATFRSGNRRRFEKGTTFRSGTDFASHGPGAWLAARASRPES